MLPPSTISTYQNLVQQLMLRGWYRLGQGPSVASNRPTWGFREGHLLESAHANIRWIPAQNEQRAMQTLLATLRSESGDRPRRRKTASRAHR